MGEEKLGLILPGWLLSPYYDTILAVKDPGSAVQCQGSISAGSALAECPSGPTWLWMTVTPCGGRVLWHLTAWVWTPALPLRVWVTLCMLFNFSVPQFSHCRAYDHDNLTESLWSSGINEIVHPNCLAQCLAHTGALESLALRWKRNLLVPVNEVQKGHRWGWSWVTEVWSEDYLSHSVSLCLVQSLMLISYCCLILSLYPLSHILSSLLMPASFLMGPHFQDVGPQALSWGASYNTGYLVIFELHINHK